MNGTTNSDTETDGPTCLAEVLVLGLEPLVQHGQAAYKAQALRVARKQGAGWQGKDRAAWVSWCRGTAQPAPSIHAHGVSFLSFFFQGHYGSSNSVSLHAAFPSQINRLTPAAGTSALLGSAACRRPLAPSAAAGRRLGSALRAQAQPPASQLALRRTLLRRRHAAQAAIGQQCALQRG